MKTKKIIGLWAAAASMSCVPALTAADNSFLVAPGRVQVDVEERETHSVIITNTGEDPIRLSIMPVYLPIDDPTIKAGTHLRPGVDQEENIADNIRLSPPRLMLQPGQRRDIRFQISPLANPMPGDYRAHILVRMDETAYTSEQKPNSDGMSMELDIKMETAVAIYGRKGDPVVDLGMACKTDGGVAAVSIRNPTNWRFEGRLTSESSENTPFVILRESERTLSRALTSNDPEPSFSISDRQGNIISEAVCTKTS